MKWKLNGSGKVRKLNIIHLGERHKELYNWWLSMLIQL